MTSHKDLEVWKRSMDFVTSIYKLTEGFPKIEMYGLCSQIRRAAVSIPSNIAEGASRKSTVEYQHFLHISKASAAELNTQLIISKNLFFLEAEEFEKLDKQLDEISRMLIGLIKSLESRKKND